MPFSGLLAYSWYLIHLLNALMNDKKVINFYFLCFGKQWTKITLELLNKHAWKVLENI